MKDSACGSSVPGHVSELVADRGRWVVIVLQAALVLLALRGGFLQIVRGEAYDRKQRRGTLSSRPTPAPRGKILTSDGLVLACDLPRWIVPIDLQSAAGNPRKRSPEERRLRLQALLDEILWTGPWAPCAPPGELLARALERFDAGLRYLRLGVLHTQEEREDFLRWKATWEEQRGVRCFSPLEMRPRRAYPNGSLASQVVGNLRPDRTGGQWGIECAFDSELRGVGGLRVLRCAGGGRLRAFDGSEAEGILAIRGRDAVLTIRARIQAFLEELLVETREKWNASMVTGIVMDPRNGALLALASAPLLGREEFSTLYAGDPALRAQLSLRRLQTTHVVMEPGSTIKPFVLGEALLAGLEPGRRVSPGGATRILRRGRHTRVVHDSHDCGPVTLEEAVIHSSNIGMAEVGRLLGGERLRRAFARFRFGEATGFELFEERGGVQDEARWKWDTTISTSFGYELTVTPLQLARAYAAIANGGVLVTPHLIARLGGEAAPSPPTERILPEAIAVRVREVLRRVVLEGTGSRLDGEEIGLAGKSGTAKKNRDGEYVDGLYVSSFIGFAP
ncbi:MAG: peptidoglycan D,D-transpeptidase FtsI family protein [Planctomycetota bacterium]